MCLNFVTGSTTNDLFEFEGKAVEQMEELQSSLVSQTTHSLFVIPSKSSIGASKQLVPVHLSSCPKKKSWQSPQN